MIMLVSWSFDENQRCLMRSASLRILVAGNVAGAFEIPEHAAAAGIDQSPHGGIGVLRRVMDLRNVVDGGNTVVELREAADQFAGVDILRPVVAGEAVVPVSPASMFAK